MKYLSYVLLALYLTGALVFKYVPMAGLVLAYRDASEETVTVEEGPVEFASTYVYEKDGFGGEFTITLTLGLPDALEVYTADGDAEEFIRQWAKEAGIPEDSIECSFERVQPDQTWEPDSWMNAIGKYLEERNGGAETVVGSGMFEYYEGPLSSYIGVGTFVEYGDGTVVLTEDGEACQGRVYRFRHCDLGSVLSVEDGVMTMTTTPEYLEFIAEGSDSFTYLKVEDGDRFVSKNMFPGIKVNKWEYSIEGAEEQ